MSCMRTSQIITALKKKSTNPYASDQSEKTENGVSVTTGQAEHGPPGASQENQGSDHGKSAKDKSNDGNRTSPWAEFLKRIGGNQ